MAYQEKPGDGVLFKNTKGEGERAPSMTGYITAHRDIKAGEKLRLAAWTKGGNDGKDKFLSLKMSDEQRREGQQQTRAPADDPFG